MNPLRVFSNIYFGGTLLYDRVFSYGDSSWFAGAAISGLFQWINFLTLWNLTVGLTSLIKISNPIFYFLTCVLLITINIFRFGQDKKYKEILKHWDSATKTRRNFIFRVTMSYCLLSFGLFIVSNFIADK